MTKSCARANNHKSTHHNFQKEQKASNEARNQERFHKDFLQSEKNGIITGRLQYYTELKYLMAKGVILLSQTKNICSFRP